MRDRGERGAFYFPVCPLPPLVLFCACCGNRNLEAKPGVWLFLQWASGKIKPFGNYRHHCLKGRQVRNCRSRERKGQDFPRACCLMVTGHLCCAMFQA